MGRDESTELGETCLLVHLQLDAERRDEQCLGLEVAELALA